MHHEEDQQVVAAVLAGDVNAFSILVARYQKPVFNLMLRMTGSQEDAVDLAQETFLKAYEQLHRFRRDRKFFTWLYTIGLNHARNFLRRSKASRSLFVEDNDAEPAVDRPDQNEDNICMQLDSRRLQEALRLLPVDYREAVVLRYHQELSMEDVAQALEISVSGAKMRVHRGLKKLKDLLEKNHHENENLASSTG
jgi:RNA polymerase sigma-70 factor (ECF subfamily)